MARRRNSVAPRESLIQAAVVDHWRTLGQPRTLVAAIPNANAHGQPGLTKGLPDLMVIGPRVPGNIAFIELKREPKSPVSEAQRDFAALCRGHDIDVVITVGRDEPIRVLEGWGVIKRAAA
jgi:hypothetical protein